MTLETGLPLSEIDKKPDKEFAEEWKLRYMLGRARMSSDISRWLRLLRFFHPTQLQHHWQDSGGNPLPKLYKSNGLSVEIYNWCRPIIEVYGSLLAGQKPLPFTIDVPPLDPGSELDRFRADAQEKILIDEIYDQRIPLHFLDFCVSVVLFGIGYVCSWIDPETKRLRTQTIPWPGDVIPEWGSDRYGRGADSLESVILTERIPLDTARRLYPAIQFTESFIDLNYRPDADATSTGFRAGSVTILRIWWRWGNYVGKKRKDHVGYSEICLEATADGEPTVLYREDDTGYPDIPLRWASRFQTPGEPPHKSAGVLDDVVGINTEYNERLSAFSDMLMNLVYKKYKGKGFTAANAPRLTEGNNIIPMGFQQDLLPLVDSVNQFPFDSFLTRLESMMLTVAGLSRLIMGSIPPGSDNSGEALQNLLHASISRLEVVRTPIQWAWTSVFEDLWVPLMKEFYVFSAKDVVGVSKKVAIKKLFDGFTRVAWVWPDVTPRDSIKATELAINLARAGLLSDESAMGRAQIPSAVDEIEKIRKQRQDNVLHPLDVRNTLMADDMKTSVEAKALQLRGQITSTDSGFASRLGGAFNIQNGPGQLDQSNLEAQAAMAPRLGTEDNSVPPGSQTNAVQGLQQGVPPRIG